MASLLWATYLVWSKNTLCIVGRDISQDQWWCPDAFSEPTKLWVETLSLNLGPPILAGVVMAMVIWIVQGFTTSN